MNWAQMNGDRALSQLRRSRRMQWLSLLLTSSTLVCCVLPAALVLVGAGSVMAALVNTVPSLVALSEHKAEVFGLAGGALTIAAIGLFRQSRANSCPTDPDLRRACLSMRRQARAMFGLSLFGYSLAVVVTFLLPKLL